MAGVLLKNVLQKQSYSFGNIANFTAGPFQYPILEQLDITQYIYGTLIVRWHSVNFNVNGAYIKFSLYADGWIPWALGTNFKPAVEFTSVTVGLQGGPLVLGPTLSIAGARILGPAASLVIEASAVDGGLVDATVSVDLCLRSPDATDAASAAAEAMGGHLCDDCAASSH